MTEIREAFLNYLVRELKFLSAECKIAWNGVDDYFTEATELTKEVMTRDILKKQTNIESLRDKYNKWGNAK